MSRRRTMAFVNSFCGTPLQRPSFNLRNVCSIPCSTRMVATAERLETDNKNVNLTKFNRLRGQAPLPVPEPSKVGFSYDEFEAAIAKFDYSFEVGDTVKGRVFQIEHNGALVDIGAKASAFLPLQEMAIMKVDRPEDAVEEGAEYDLQIVSREDANGQLRVSLRRILYARAWDKVLKMQADDVTMEAEIVSVNRGGCLMVVEGLRAFLPGSHMTVRTPRDDMVGVVLSVKFLEVDPDKNRLVVSQRRAIVEQQMQTLVAGAVITGIVRGVKPYGAFIDMNGVSGLLHVSQISHDHVSDIPSLFKDGDTVKAMIINQDKEKGRISLSTKTLEPEPGDMLKDSKMVYDMADEMAARYHKRLEEERKAAADIADDIVSTLDMASLDDLGVDPVVAAKADDPVSEPADETSPVAASTV